MAAVTAAVDRPPMPLRDLGFVSDAAREAAPGGRLVSGGEQQMLAIARALVTNWKLLLLEQPSAGLSSGITRTLVGAIGRIRQSGVAIVLVEQNMEIARAVRGSLPFGRRPAGFAAGIRKQWRATKPNRYSSASIATRCARQ